MVYALHDGSNIRKPDATGMEYVDDLGDEFTTRLKLSRLSNKTRPVFTKTGKLSKKQAFEKLIDLDFEHQSKYAIERITIKHKTYHEPNHHLRTRCPKYLSRLFVAFQDRSRFSFLKGQLGMGNLILFGS